MAPITNVAVIGKGFLGSAIVEQLAQAGFTVTVLSRNPGSVKDLPAGVKLAKIDYSSPSTIATTLQGQDAVINTSSNKVTLEQKVVIDACIQAGVRRYVPSDWGTFTTDPAAIAALPILASMVEIQKYLEGKAQTSSLEYTIFSVGSFLDLIIGQPFIVDFKHRSGTLYDDGNHPFSSTSIAGVGKAVAGALRNPEATKNRNVFIHEVVLSQAKLLMLGRKYTPGENWTVTRLDSEAEYQTAFDAVNEDGLESPKGYALLGAAIFGGKFASAYKSVDNEAVGLECLSDEQLEAKIAAMCN